MATADYAVNLDFWDKIQPKIRAWEIAHQRPMPKQQYQALVEGELSVATTAAENRATRGRALAIEEGKLSLAKEQADKAASAAKVKGVTDLASTAGMGYLAYKQIGVSEKGAAATDKLTEYIISGGKKPPGTEAAFDLGKFSAPTAEKAGFGLGGSAAPAIDMAGISPGAFGAPTAAEAGYGLGGQAALSETAPILATNTSFAGSAAATEAIAAESGGAAAVGSEGAAAGAGTGTVVLAGAAGYAAGYLLSKAFGANEDITQGLELGLAGAGIGAYLAMGTAVGGPVGALAGLAVGVGVSLFDDSVVCSELLRQKRITELERGACVVYRCKHIDDRMFAAYREWAGPHVMAMRRGGWRNWIRLPFAIASVNYMIAKVRGRKPTWFEKAVFSYAWKKCERIADRTAIKEVA